MLRVRAVVPAVRVRVVWKSQYSCECWIYPDALLVRAGASCLRVEEPLLVHRPPRRRPSLKESLNINHAATISLLVSQGERPGAKAYCQEGRGRL